MDGSGKSKSKSMIIVRLTDDIVSEKTDMK